MECLKLDIVADSQQRKQEEEHEHEQEQEEQHFHVLAVDDSLIDRKLLEKLLKVSSYKVTCVHSGDEALKYLGLLDDLDQNSPPSSSFSSPSPLLEGSKVNLIMTDYCMPGISGYDLLKRVKGSSWKDVPVVIMSSENVPSRISKCLEGGAEEFLLKPLQLSDLKNLEHYLLKPTTTMDDDFSASDDSNNEDDNKSDDADDNKSNNNNMISKRKAASPGPSERLPKVKGVAVV
ncbi:hypothetical protein UlMin_035846 [Ulmus minor]